jgi:hypothetical protein
VHYLRDIQAEILVKPRLCLLRHSTLFFAAVEREFTACQEEVEVESTRNSLQ